MTETSDSPPISELEANQNLLHKWIEIAATSGFQLIQYQTEVRRLLLVIEDQRQMLSLANSRHHFPRWVTITDQQITWPDRGAWILVHDPNPEPGCMRFYTTLYTGEPIPFGFHWVNLFPPIES